jgi:hypothetical protein
MNILKLKLFLISFAALILSGCAYNSPVPGVIFTSTTFPSGDKVKLDSETVSKQGKSSCYSVFALVAFGNCSITSAMTDGRITKIHHVDSSSMNVLFVFFRYDTIVYGE